jgi:hypothetical protein
MEVIKYSTLSLSGMLEGLSCLVEGVGGDYLNVPEKS